MTTSSAPRDTWATRVGFLMATLGSAVGLGTMWRFAYLASERGGAAFVLAYLVMVAVVGIPVLTAEFVLGRLGQTSPVVAVPRLAGRAWVPLAWLFVGSGFVLLSYYSVVSGWTLRYAWDAAVGRLTQDAPAYFARAASGPDAAAAHVLFMAMTVAIVARGVKHGLERANMIMMPALFAILAALVLWAATLDGGGPGYAAYLAPRLGDLWNLQTLSWAAGQTFFALSVGIGGMATYASYLRSQENLGREATTIALADTAVAFVAGLMVFPIIFHFGLQDRVAESTIGALFISVPAALATLGRSGDFLTAAFFVMLFFAALTSAISVLEVVVAAGVDGRGWSRRRTAVGTGAAITALGLPAAFSTALLGAIDEIVGNVLIIVGGLGICAVVGYRLRAAGDAELARGLANAGARRVWAMFVRYVAPALLLVVLWSALQPVWQAVRALLRAG
jgi:NSS family neurotransmitter:Na+ symporter